MKKFCPNCGKPVKETDNVCGNCGHQLKQTPVSNQTETSFPPTSPQKSDSVQNTRANYAVKNKGHKKGIMWTCAAVLAVVIIGGGIFAGHQYLTNKNHQTEMAQDNNMKSSKKAAKSSTKENNRTENSEEDQADNTDSNISADEWMMMGYIAYKAKDSDTTQAIDDVKNYFNDGDLKAYKNSDGSYTLTNEYGSVDVDVKEDEVVVSNDGTSTFSKYTLKDNFGGEMSTIESLTGNISNSSNSEDSDD